MKISLPICYDAGVIETESALCDSPSHISSACELAPNVWLRDDPDAGQFVEIVMPPFELNDLIARCEANLPVYVLQVCERLALRHPEALSPETKFSPARIQGLLNTQILGSVLAEQNVRGERALPILSELKQAFGLAMQGRLRLTADPVPNL